MPQTRIRCDFMNHATLLVPNGMEIRSSSAFIFGSEVVAELQCSRGTWQGRVGVSIKMVDGAVELTSSGLHAQHCDGARELTQMTLEELEGGSVGKQV